MLVKDIAKVSTIIAGDGSSLKEVLNERNDRVKLGYSLAHARLTPGQQTRSHRLKSSSETYLILEGEGRITVDNENQNVKANQLVFIPANTAQKIVNTGKTDLVFLCICDPAWKQRDEQVIEKNEMD